MATEIGLTLKIRPPGRPSLLSHSSIDRILIVSGLLLFDIQSMLGYVSFPFPFIRLLHVHLFVFPFSPEAKFFIKVMLELY